ncbi:DUF1269 domain-containing protein [Microbacterium flavescens]|nr:DUF1269 domain-containing protein [Microbacterium flavescens]BFF11829.1 hypothetical protein GCM10025699_31320 [Microbacterium flavescens]
MADQQFVAIAAQYADEAVADADFDEMVTHLKESGHKHDFFDAALIRRGLDGKLTLVKREDSGKHRSTKKGLKIGLATGLAVALFPAVALGSALVVAGGSGAGLGAIAGHISRKSPSKDLEAISETLNAGSAGIVLVVDPADADEVKTSLVNATKVTQKDLAVDSERLDEEVDEAYE